MKAYALYQQDLTDGGVLARTKAPRRQYYLDIRAALRDEAAARDCELLSRWGKALEKDELEHMYLLDAAALWECYEAVIGGSRFPRDVGRGLPFVVDGRTLPWTEVQQLSDAGKLPAALVDEELGGRLRALLQHISARGREKKAAPLNARAAIRTADPREVKQPAPQQTSAAAAVGEASPQLEALRAENAALRARLEQLQANQETDREYAQLAARRILQGSAQEAREAIGKLDAQLQEAAAALEKAVAEQRELEARFAEVSRELEASQASLEALRTQTQEAEAALAKLRSERETAQLDAGRAVLDRQRAEEELQSAMEQLDAVTQSLRAVRKQAEETKAARRLTQRQLEAVTEQA